ncbi:hypothetical protein D3C86_1882690 [compost metagenome]
MQAVAVAHAVLLPVHQFPGLHQGEVGGQQFGLVGGHQQMLRAVHGDALLEGRVELVHLVGVHVGHAGDTGQVQALLLDLHHFEVGFVGDRAEVHAIGFGRHHQL